MQCCPLCWAGCVSFFFAQSAPDRSQPQFEAFLSHWFWCCCKMYSTTTSLQIHLRLAANTEAFSGIVSCSLHFWRQHLQSSWLSSEQTRVQSSENTQSALLFCHIRDEKIVPIPSHKEVHQSIRVIINLSDEQIEEKMVRAVGSKCRKRLVYFLFLNLKSYKLKD